MKILLAHILLFTATFSVTWKDVPNEYLRTVIKKEFNDVNLQEVLDRVPDNIPFRNHVIMTSDAQTQKTEFRKKGTTYVCMKGNSIAVYEDGMTVFDFKVKCGIRTTQTTAEDPLGKTPFPCYYFICDDLQEEGDEVLVRVAYCRSRWGGFAYVTLFRSDDLDDWMGFRIE